MGDAGSGCNSPRLQEFVGAKKKINDIFEDLEGYVCDTDTYMQNVGVQQVGINVKSDDADQVKKYITKVGNIRVLLTRGHMKVTFFGRTSNGKSSVINAMLCKKILPTGYGHTTSCFVQVEGTDRVEPYLVVHGSTEEQKVESVEQRANALSEETLRESDLVRIYWPKDKCLLLRNEVVFVDSPGIDTSPTLDEWIESYCLDADIFVFVANAECILTCTEKDFLVKVPEKFAKPNIFILNNKWDVVASNSDSPDKVRKQHKEKAVEFLVKELKKYTQEEANQRIFFVSAKEVLETRLQEQKDLPADSKNNQASGKLPHGFQDRYSEFQEFERKFEECISKSAVRTKFEQHSKDGKEIVSEVRQIIKSMYGQAQKLKTQKAEAKKELDDKLKFTKKQLPILRELMKEKIRQMAKDVEQRVSKALSEEICHMSALVCEFNLPFKPAEYEYKNKLHHHVEKGLIRNLSARMSKELEKNIENSQRQMTEKMSVLLPAKEKQDLLNDLPQREPFKISYSLNCDKLFAEFREDLEFQYFKKPVTPEEEKLEAQVGSLARIKASLVGLLIVADVVATATTAATAPVSVPVIATAAATYYCIDFTHKYFAWNDEAKEKEFKRQFVAHVTKKRQSIVDSTSADCSNQVEQELSSTLAQICRFVEKAVNDMDKEIKTLNEEIKQLEEAANKAEHLLKKADDIATELEIFDKDFLKLNNKALASDRM